MSRTLVECVPNFSEGRDPDKIQEIVAAIQSAGVSVLAYEMDADHNRSVVTFAGPAGRMVEAAFRGVARAVDLIDLRTHVGVHPRIGAADVVPFVPIEGVTLADCARLAEALGQRLWDELGLPVYLYEAAARRPVNERLENIRRGQFERLREEVRDNPDRAPDFGGNALHESAGATVVGARKFLIAFNINLATGDVDVARAVARKVRASSGGLAHVKAMGVPLASRNLAQVSMNLTDYETTPVATVYEAVRKEASRHGAAIHSSEIIGLVPRRALEQAAEQLMHVEKFDPGIILETRLESVLGTGLHSFLEELATPAATPGGGSASAAAAAMAAALGAMVSELAGMPAEGFAADRRFFAGAVERDTAAYEEVARLYRQPKSEQAGTLEQALTEAARVPIEVAEEASAMAGRLTTLLLVAPPQFRADLEAAAALARGALSGAAATVRIRLESMHDQEAVKGIEERLGRLALD